MNIRRYLPALMLAFATSIVAQTPSLHRGGPHVERLAILLDLDEYQKAEVQKILKEQHSQMESARAQAGGSGERPSREEVRVWFEQWKQGSRAKLETILTAEQLKKFEALHEVLHDERRQWLNHH